MSVNLLSLPNEILGLIFDQICIPSDPPGCAPRQYPFSLRLQTYDISCTCRRLYKLLQPRLYFDSHIIYTDDEPYFRFQGGIPFTALDIQRKYEAYYNNGAFLRTLNVAHDATWDEDYAKEMAFFQAKTPQWLQLNILDLLNLILPRFHNLKRVQFSYDQISPPNKLNTLLAAIKSTIQQCPNLREFKIHLDVFLHESNIGDSITVEQTAIEYPCLDELSISIDTGVEEINGAELIRILEALCGLLWPAAESITTLFLRCEVYKIKTLVDGEPDILPDIPTVAFKSSKAYKLPRVKVVQANMNATSLWVLQNLFAIDGSEVRVLVLEKKNRHEPYQMEYGFCSKFRNISSMSVVLRTVSEPDLLELIRELIRRRNVFRQLEEISIYYSEYGSYVVDNIKRSCEKVRVLRRTKNTTEVILPFKDLEFDKFNISWGYEEAEYETI
ncbi:hypothetical protein AA313_de0206308 [Arthrobotrys entomopaga]|nr:hypothetical protein AA313_de0206308 [Arthrobotrys entomopaga]